MAQIVRGTLGEEIHVTDGKYLGMTSAFSGGDPAYIFLFVEELVDAGLRIGLSRDMAQELVIQTILGSTLTVERTGKHPANLSNMVTSPGGTTTGALLHLEKGRFSSLVLEAVAAAYEKAERF
ncbi:pyrroline-5-carboxylate reductase dimerization domain-containing protein [Chloroflexota bacterium]